MSEKNNTFSIELDEADLNQMEDVYNSNIQVAVTLQNGFTLTLIVGTPKNLQYLMKKDKVNFYGPDLPWIIVQKLTKEIIEEAIEAYMEDRPDGYWLKLYYFATDIDIATLNQLEAKEIDESIKFNLLIGLDDLKVKINKLDNLDKSNLMVSLDKLYKDLRIWDEE